MFCHNFMSSALSSLRSLPIIFLLTPSVHCSLASLSPPILGNPIQCQFWDPVTYHSLKISNIPNQLPPYDLGRIA